jgi:hypothetical protein
MMILLPERYEYGYIILYNDENETYNNNIMIILLLIHRLWYGKEPARAAGTLRNRANM